VTTLRKFCFVVKGRGYRPDLHRAAIDSGEFCTVLVGVAHVDAALTVVREAVSEGIQLIELCGGFTREEAAILEGASNGVPIGLVTYTKAQEERLRMLFSTTSVGGVHETD
jgi:hypothetical protein